MCTAVRIGSEYTDDLLEHAWQKLLGKFAYRLVQFCFGFVFFSIEVSSLCQNQACFPLRSWCIPVI